MHFSYSSPASANIAHIIIIIMHLAIRSYNAAKLGQSLPQTWIIPETYLIFSAVLKSALYRLKTVTFKYAITGLFQAISRAT